MKAVFTEASMRAWQMLGACPELKAYFEKSFGDLAYEAGILYLAASRALMKTRPDTFPEYLGSWSDPEDIDKYANAMQEMGVDPMDDDWWGPISKHPPARAELRKRSSDLLRASAEGGLTPFHIILGDIAKNFPVPDPDDYNQTEVVLDLEDGWRWVQVPEGDCRGAEGRNMQHCGKSAGQMISLRDPQGKPHVTVELQSQSSFVGDGPFATKLEPGIVQIKGKQNEFPGKKYWPMIKKLFDSLPPELRNVSEPDAPDELVGYLVYGYDDY